MVSNVKPADELIAEDDAFIASALESAYIPPLIMSVIHLTGDKEFLNGSVAMRNITGVNVDGSISDAELDANPALVKSMSVQPPRGSGSIRTIRIGADALIDLQPCGGTHVANTAEIGAVVVTKIEKKSATTRRVVLGFAL